jgi:hypothetical protein
MQIGQDVKRPFLAASDFSHDWPILNAICVSSTGPVKRIDARDSDRFESQTGGATGDRGRELGRNASGKFGAAARAWLILQALMLTTLVASRSKLDSN